METPGKRQIWTKKMADSRFALSNQNIVEQLKENAKNTLKATQTWLNVWQTVMKASLSMVFSSKFV